MSCSSCYISILKNKNLLPTDEETTWNKQLRADDISHNISMENSFTDLQAIILQI